MQNHANGRKTRQPIEKEGVIPCHSTLLVYYPAGLVYHSCYTTQIHVGTSPQLHLFHSNKFAFSYLILSDWRGLPSMKIMSFLTRLKSDSETNLVFSH